MFKKYTSYLGIFILALFSFYYTDKATDIIKRNDPIMKKIDSNKDKYNISPVNAYIDDDEIIPGLNGVSININKSYQKMKKNDNYDESLYVFKEVTPTISFINDYSKYIVSGNSLKNQISLVFKVNDLSYFDELINILNDKNIKATIFIDGTILENNTLKIIELSHDGFELENLGYDGKYTLDKISWTNNLLSSITNINPKYCYTDYKVKEILDLCSSYNMYTIKPSLSVINYPFITIKHDLKPGSIISFNINKEVIKELPSIISYIKQKGYELVDLDTLLVEDLDK